MIAAAGPLHLFNKSLMNSWLKMKCLHAERSMQLFLERLLVILPIGIVVSVLAYKTAACGLNHELLKVFEMHGGEAAGVRWGHIYSSPTGRQKLQVSSRGVQSLKQPCYSCLPP